MPTVTSVNNLQNINSLNPINIVSADDISLSGGNLIDIAGTNGTTIEDTTSVAITGGNTVTITATTGYAQLLSTDSDVFLIAGNAAIIISDSNVIQMVSPPQYGVRIDNNTHFALIMVGTGSPNGSLTAAQGSMYLNVAGTGNDTLFVNTDGATAWVNPNSGGGSSFTWTEDTGAGPIALVANNGHFAGNAGTITYTLPSVASMGDTFAVYGIGNNAWTIAQNAGQFIAFGNLDTTTGTGGSLSANEPGDGVTLVCYATNVSFMVTQAVGNPTIV